MYVLVPSKRFRRQVKKLASSNPSLFKKLERTIETLRLEHTLPRSYRDHALAGNLKSFRECHIAPDWLLIYRKHDDILVLELIATGTHAELLGL